MKNTAHPTWHRHANLILLILLAVRLLAIWWVPLTDTTEARYAEIARKMLETGNWVTPLHDYGVPFWAKPPLSTWLSAISMGLFGVNEFAVRLPSILLAIGSVWLTGLFARRHSGEDTAKAAMVILASSLLFYAASGTSMTDPSLAFCVALSQIAFWFAVVNRSKLWGYLFFVGLGIGLLAKGPLAIVLVGMPIFIWVLVRNQWLALWKHLPWISGSLLMLAIAAPWYLWAEHRTPGFLYYFIVGEHISRFLDSGWKGDKYGFAHATPKGMIWPYAFGALLPWSVAMLLWLARQGKRISSLTKDQDGWVLYLALWALMTLLFFTISGNIIFPYPLPILPGAALLFAELWQRGRHNTQLTTLPWIGLLSAVLLAGLLIVVGRHTENYVRTEKDVIASWQARHPAAGSLLVYWHDRREFSAEFYSQGKVRTTIKPEQLLQYLKQPGDHYIVADQRDLQRLPEQIKTAFSQVSQTRVVQDQMILLKQTAPLP